MLKSKDARLKKIDAVGVTFLTIVSVLSCLNMEAVGAPNSKTLTPEQFARKSQDYLRYRQYVQTQVQKRYQAVQSQRLQQSQQLAKNASATAETQPQTPYKPMPINRQEILLVMPAKGAKSEDITQSIAAAQGEICGTLGGGALSVILVKAARPGKLIELQRALALDTKDFKHVDYNRKGSTDFIPTTEPTFSDAWHLMRMRITDAWDEIAKYPNFPMPVAVFDTGTQGPEPFLVDRGADCTGDKTRDKADGINLDGFLGTGLFSDSIKDQEKDIIKFGNDIRARTSGNMDPNGHGTWVGCTITGSPYNSLGAAGVNPLVPAYPIKIANAAGNSDDLSVIAAMCVMYTFGPDDMRIINISSGPYEDARSHAVLHEFFKDWYNRRNGLIFISAGNAGENLKAVNQPYINVVSAMANKADMQLVKNKKWQSAFGTPVDFTAPGINIQVCDQNGKSNNVGGTSFSSPIVAGVASMIWLINPKLKNTEVLKILVDSCDNTDDAGTWNPQFGWGMPDAYKACLAAEATVGKR
jgi:hypothetical protein